MTKRPIGISCWILWASCAALLASLASLVAARAAAQGAGSATGSIHVGPNVEVSKALEKYSFGEVTLSADPVDPHHLLGCSVVYGEQENRRWTAAFLTTDGGETWQPTLDTKRFKDSADEYCALGRDGLASYISIGFVGEKDLVLGLSRSTDGGRTWTQERDLPMKFQGIDREALAIDTTGGKYNNRVYITGTTETRGLGDADPSRYAFGVWVSHDGGKTFEGPMKREAAPNLIVLEPGNSVILSDGTLVSLFGYVKIHGGAHPTVVQSTPGEPNASLEAITVTGGGDTLNPAVKIDDWALEWGSGGDLFPSAIGMPDLAVDSSGGPFQDSLYAVWADERGGRSAIRFSYSRDQGKTWSKSAIVDEGPAEGKGPENFLPVVAVNKRGVVGLLWYDRRNHLGHLGWDVRFRASLDGGDTWTPSVKVSEQTTTFSPQKSLFSYAQVASEYARRYGPPHPKSEGSKFPKAEHVSVGLQGRQFDAGDYAGLVADTSGVFHGFWIGNPTGREQVWTAPVTVVGRAIRNGSRKLSEMKDVTTLLHLKATSVHYDHATSTLTLGVELKNPSKTVVEGPLELRLFNLSSPLGDASPLNAEVAFHEEGGVWDLSRVLKNNILKPGDTSGVAQLRFRIDHPRPLINGRNYHLQLLDFDARILAGGTDKGATGSRN